MMKKVTDTNPNLIISLIENKLLKKILCTRASLKFLIANASLPLKLYSIPMLLKAFE